VVLTGYSRSPGSDELAIQQLRKLHDAPNEIQVNFGLKLSADAGAGLAAAGAEANYTVTLKWIKEAPTNKAKQRNSSFDAHPVSKLCCCPVLGVL